jgi:CTP:molybdopterin cytidylyltransferase MocA
MKGYRLTRPLVVILAAGFSRRLGRPKALARIGGVSLLERTLRLCAVCSALPPLCILPPRAAGSGRQLRALGARVAVNARRAQGLSSSVRLGLARGRYAPAILWLPVDLAQLESQDLIRMVRRWCGARRRVVARRLGDALPARGGAPMILPKTWFGAAAAVRGDVGLRDLLAAAPTPLLRLVALPSAELDVDTAADLTRARRRYARGCGRSR